MERPGSVPKRVHVHFVINKVALRKILLQKLQFPPVKPHCNKCYVLTDTEPPVDLLNFLCSVGNFHKIKSTWGQTCNAIKKMKNEYV